MVDTGFTSPIALTPEPHCEVMTLPSLFAYEDMAEVFAGIADPAVVANLTAVSRSLAKSFATPHLWASQLVRRFEVDKSEADDMVKPRREFARRAVCAAIQTRWATTPTTGPTRGATSRQPLRPPSPMSPTAAPRWADRFDGAGSSVTRSWSPEGSPAELNKENRGPQRRPLRRIGQPRGLGQYRGSDDNDCDPGSTARRLEDPSERQPVTAAARACVIARLRAGMRQIVMGGFGDELTACPEKPDDWSNWTARVTCPRKDGAAVAGMVFQLRLTYSLVDGTDVESAHAHEGAMPRVKVLSPARFFHPNVHPTSGLVCAGALATRCSPVELVADQLKAVLSILRRPVFSVPPVNAEAAACWYGDEQTLRTRVRGGAPPPAVDLSDAAADAESASITPLVRRVVSLGL